jgi:Holliday junction resolvasome RuvABC endonuclease subunit
MMFKIVPPRRIDSDCRIVGIDPGTVNIGIADYRPDFGCYVYQIKTTRDDDPVNRIKRIGKILTEILFNPLTYTNNIMIIEGSSFGARFRQVELGEMRAATMMWGVKYNFDPIKVVAPNSIRKQVFGSGKIKAHEVWEGLPNDALAALSAIYYGATPPL